VDGIFLSDFEQGEIGPDLFRHVCLMGPEGMVSKHRENTYRGGRWPSAIRCRPRPGVTHALFLAGQPVKNASPRGFPARLEG
jgi:ATP-dependent DNA ligase